MIFAKIVLFLFPLAGIALFVARGRQSGAIWTVCLGYLFVPSGLAIDMPGLPNYGKAFSIALALGLGALATRGRDGPAPVPLKPLVWGIIALVCLSFVATWLANTDTVFEPGRVLPGLGLADTRLNVLGLAVAATPMVIGARYLASRDAAEEFSSVLLFLAGIYAVLALVEVRLSPQLHTWVYGYFPSEWRHHVRGGFRPVVFLNHGLGLGIFLAVVTLLAAGRVRRGGQSAGPFVFLLLLLYGTLAISQNFGAFLIATVFLPMVFFLTSRGQVRMALVFAAIFFFYPILRGAGLVPLGAFTDWVATISPQRAASFSTRLVNEELFLARHEMRPLFGWGGWGRARTTTESGNDISLADGLWVLRLVQYGWFGYLAFFGLLIAPVVAVWRASRRLAIDPVIGSFMLALAANFVDLIPNSNFSPIMWMVGGMLLGYASAPRTEPGADPPVEPDGQSAAGATYTRFPRGQGGGDAPVVRSRPLQPAGMNRGKGSSTSRRTS